MYYVYAIKSLTRKYTYIGISNDIVRRLHEHNSGYNKTTKPYLPFKIIYSELYNTRIEARQQEKYLKTTTGRRFLRSLL